MKKIGVTPPEDSDNQTFLDYFHGWYYSSKKENPMAGMLKFFEEFNLGNPQVNINKMWSNDLVYAAFRGGTAENPNGCPIFHFLYPSSMELVDTHECNNCKKEAMLDYARPQKSGMLELFMPEEKTDESECLQSLVDATLEQRIYDGECVCKNLIRKQSKKYYTEADTIILKLQRLVYGEKERNSERRTFKIKNRPVKLSPVLTLPFLEGLQKKVIVMDLVCTSQHYGSENSGHFVCHALANSSFYEINDLDNNVKKSKMVDVEKSTLFFYKKRKIEDIP